MKIKKIYPQINQNYLLNILFLYMLLQETTYGNYIPVEQLMSVLQVGVCKHFLYFLLNYLNFYLINKPQLHRKTGCY